MENKTRDRKLSPPEDLWRRTRGCPPDVCPRLPAGRHGGWQPKVVAPAPALTLAGLLTGVSVWGLVHDPSPGILNGVAFAAIHAFILVRGSAGALRRTRRTRPAVEDRPAARTAPEPPALVEVGS